MTHLKKKQKVLSSMTFENNDLLKRKSIAENFNLLFENTSQPFVVALDSPWGTGKTQFIYMWKNLLKNEKRNTIYINLWEEDFFQNPFFSLIENLIHEFEKRKIGNLSEIKKNILKVGKEVSKLTINKISGIDLNKFFEENPNKIQKEEKKKFKKNLRELSNKLNEESKFPLIIFIDELDRCRPNYAVEFLEIIKHFFDVENIIFILGIDMDQLQHSIKSLYGQDMDAKEYLRKFIDFSYSLPEPFLDDYLNFLFSKFGCGNKNKFLIGASKEIIKRFKPSLRKVDNLFTRLNLIEKDIHNSYIEASFFLSLKIFDEEKYNKITKSYCSLDEIFGIKFYFENKYHDYREIIFWNIANDLILRNSNTERDYLENIRIFFSKLSEKTDILTILRKINPNERSMDDKHFSLEDLLKILIEDIQITEEKNQKIIRKIFNSRNYYLKSFLELIKKIDFLENLDFSKEEKIEV